MADTPQRITIITFNADTRSSIYAARPTEWFAFDLSSPSLAHRRLLVNMKGVLYFAGYVLVFIAALWGVIWWDRSRRRTRRPFPENLKLLRMPGE